MEYRGKEQSRKSPLVKDKRQPSEFHYNCSIIPEGPLVYYVLVFKFHSVTLRTTSIDNTNIN